MESRVTDLGECVQVVAGSDKDGKDITVCAAKEHNHCFGCYNAKVPLGQMYCSPDCNQMVNDYNSGERD